MVFGKVSNQILILPEATAPRTDELRPKFTVMEGSAPNIFFFEIELGHGKQQYIHSWKTITGYNRCLCLMLVFSHPLSDGAGSSVPLCKHSISLTIYLAIGKLQNPVSNMWYLVMCIAVRWWSVNAAVCTACWVIVMYCTATYISVFYLGSCQRQRAMLGKGRDKALHCLGPNILWFLLVDQTVRPTFLWRRNLQFCGI